MKYTVCNELHRFFHIQPSKFNNNIEHSKELTILEQNPVLKNDN